MSEQRFKLGDAVAKIAKVLHIPHCEECERRRLILNEIRSVGVPETIRRLRAVGFSFSGNKSDPRSMKKLMKQMEDCCDK